MLAKKIIKVPYLDLRVRDATYKKRLLKKFEDILDHGRIVDGPELKKFEERFASEIGAKFAVGVGSGSSALYLALVSLGIGRGDEVITTPYTWIITTNAIAATGAKPVFVDVLDDFNIDPDSISKAITKKTKAIVPMHVAGHMCDMERILTIAEKHSLYVVEDAAHAYCSSNNGMRAGAFSNAAAFSMNPMKILHAYGEAGVVITNDEKTYKIIKQLRHAGTTRFLKKSQNINMCEYVSLNHKMDTLQAAFLIEELDRIDEIKTKRDVIAKFYDKNIVKIGCSPQEARPSEVHGRYFYMFSCKNRDELFEYLTKKGVECKIFYSPLTSDVKVYKNNNTLDLPMARRLLRNSLSIPMHENMTIEQAKYVVSSIKTFFEAQ